MVDGLSRQPSTSSALPVRLDDVNRNTTTPRNLVPVPLRPLADRLILITSRPRFRRRSRTPPDPTARTTPSPDTRGQVRVENVPQLAGVLLRQVDRVVHPIQP